MLHGSLHCWSQYAMSAPVWKGEGRSSAEGCPNSIETALLYCGLAPLPVPPLVGAWSSCSTGHRDGVSYLHSWLMCVCVCVCARARALARVRTHTLVRRVCCASMGLLACTRFTVCVHAGAIATAVRKMRWVHEALEASGGLATQQWTAGMREGLLQLLADNIPRYRLLVPHRPIHFRLHPSSRTPDAPQTSFPIFPLFTPQPLVTHLFSKFKLMPTHAAPSPRRTLHSCGACPCTPPCLASTSHSWRAPPWGSQEGAVRAARCGTSSRSSNSRRC